jgi:acetyl-CoA synthase
MDIFSVANQTDETKVRRQGIGFIDGTISGYVLLLGNDEKQLPGLVQSLTERQMVVFAEEAVINGLQKAGLAPSWESRVIQRDPISAMGFVVRVAQVFSGLNENAAVIKYARERLRGFTLLLGEPLPERLALAQSALELGCPLLSTTELPTLVNEWRSDGILGQAAMGGIDPSDIVQIGIEERGLRVHAPMPPLPVEYGSDFSGEVVRDAGADLYGVELVVTGKDIIDGRIRVIGPDLEAGLIEHHSYGLLIEVSGREMQLDFESVLERQVETLLNDLRGVTHRGQRANSHVCVSRDAIAKGLRLRHLGEILHSRLRNEFGNIISRVQVTFFTDAIEVERLTARAQSIYEQRDHRLAGLTDEAVDTFYTCTLCQTIAAGHLCVISPEHPGVCGAQDWMDTRAVVSIRPVGPNRAVEKTGLIDARLGQWESVNQIVQQESGGALNAYSVYSMMQDPGTACGDFDCITAMLPLVNGVMVTDHAYTGMTPSGMDWSMLYETIGGGAPVPGFLGHSKRLVPSSKFIAAEGGWRRIVWMNHSLREEMRVALETLAATEGVENFVDKIATEQDVSSGEELLAHVETVQHPVLKMEPMM